MCNDGSGNTAEQVPHETAAAVRTDHDQARMALLGGLNNPSPRRRGFNCQTLRPEPFLLCERRSVRGGLLGSPSDFVRCIRVEVVLGDGLEADIGGLPYAENKRVATGRKLTPRAVDGQRRER